ncbi:DNA polymerase III subunit alpha [Candidatus Vidania fulgoroideorum]
MLINIKIYTEFSLEKGAIKINNFSREAKKKKYNNIIISDYKNISGSVEFWKEMKNNKLNPILGCEIFCYYIINSLVIKGRITLIVLNKIGYKNICKIISKKKKYFSLKKIIKLKGIKVLSGGYGGFFSNCLKKIKKIRNFLLKIKKMVFEIQIFNKKSFKESNKIYDLARKYNLKILINHPVRFLKKKDYKIFKFKNFIIKKKKIKKKNNYIKKYKNQYLIKKEKIKKIYKCFFDDLNLFSNLIKKCIYNFDYKKKKVKFWKKKINKNIFIKKSIKIFKKKNFSKEIYNSYYKRFIYELNTIYEMGFSDYFFIVRDFVMWAKKKKIIVGPGRGSSAGSLVAYVFEITEVDPIKHGLYFERFLNYKKKTIPDFDIDFCKEKRDKVIKYLRKRYGKKKVFNIVTFGRFSFKNAIKDSGRILGYNYNYVEGISKIFSYLKSFKDFCFFLKDKKNIPILYHNDKRFKKIMRISLCINGYIRNIGVHAGGIIITNKNFYNHIPIFNIEKDKALITQFDKYSIQEMGFMKFDFLCLNTLSLLKEIISKTKIKFKYSNVMFNNIKTYNLLKKGNTVGVFQLESYQVRKYLKIIKPKNFNEIVNIISLYRPGPMCLIDQYCSYKIDKNLKKFSSILTETRGVLIFQEQLMKILEKGFGFDIHEADIIRSILNKKDSFLNIKKILKKKKINYKKLFFLKKYVGYSFNKAHAVSYSYITYIMAWFKANYKKFFYICSINYNHKNLKKLRFLYKDLIKNDLFFVKPSINKSENLFCEKNKEIFMGFLFIKGIGYKVGKEIIKERKKSLFKSFFDFFFRINKTIINKRIIKNLIYSGCFDEFEKDKNKLLNKHYYYKNNYEYYKGIFIKQIPIINVKKKNIYNFPISFFVLKEKKYLNFIFYDIKNYVISNYKNLLKNNFKKFFVGIVTKKIFKNYVCNIVIESKNLLSYNFSISFQDYKNIKLNDLLIAFYESRYKNNFFCYYIEYFYVI